MGLQVALLLLDLQLGECGQHALQAAGAGQGDEEVPGLELALCCSRAASLVGDDTGCNAASLDSLNHASALCSLRQLFLGMLGITLQ